MKYISLTEEISDPFDPIVSRIRVKLQVFLETCAIYVDIVSKNH